MGRVSNKTENDLLISPSKANLSLTRDHKKKSHHFQHFFRRRFSAFDFIVLASFCGVVERLINYLIAN